MGGAAKKTAAHSTHLYGENAANDNQPPRPKLVVDNTSKSTTQKNKGSYIAARRTDKIHTQRRGEDNENVTPRNILRMRNALQYRKTLLASRKNGHLRVQQTKALITGIEAIGSVVYPAATQVLFGLLFILAVATEKMTWLSWVIPGETIALVSWLIVIMLGSYTMIVAGLMLHKHFKKTSVLLAFIFCFSLNWAPFLFIFPWTLIWIFFTMTQVKK